MLIKVCGTVSPVCYKNNNCPSYLIREGNEKILLDCGNGAMRELNLEKDLQNLTVIISHLHKDHYGDLLSLAYVSYVQNLFGILKEKIKVYIPMPNLRKEERVFTNICGKKITKLMEPTINDFLYLTNLGAEQYLDFRTYDELTILNIGEFSISFAKNPHQVNTYSTKVTTKTASVVYSSDTGYNGNCLEQFAKNTDLLICESSFLKDQVRKSDNHLYTYEAGLIAKKAQPKTLLLTHFWPGIPKEKYLNEALQEYSNTIVGEEGKILKLEKTNY